jgi:hypothetical protein
MAVPFMFFCKDMTMLQIWNGSVARRFLGRIGGLERWLGRRVMGDRLSSKMNSESEYRYSVVEWEDRSRGNLGV